MKILLGYDGVNDFTKILGLAKKHALAFNAQVDVFTATGHSPELHTPKIKKIEHQLKEIKDHLKESGILCETHLLVRSLSPGEDLLEFARSNNIDEIIIGVKQRSKIGKLIMGSTAQFVILEAPCPVVTIK